MMTLNLATLSFQEAIAYTQDWLEQIATNEIETAQILSDLKTLLSHRNGVRFRASFIASSKESTNIGGQPVGKFSGGMTIPLW